MNFDLIAQSFAGLSFRQAVWLFPLAFTLHVLEEVRQFTAWASRYASPQFTFQGYLKIHIAGIIIAFVAAAVIWFFPNKAVVFIFFTFIFTPGILYNTLFHFGATAWFGAYCPGLLTALILYLPLYYTVSTLAYREGLLSNKVGLISFVIAGVFHAAEVGHNVFKAW
jgi:hypothetical protein